MGYADRFYFGQCKLKVVTNASKVTITNGSRTWELNGSGTIMLPGTDKYIVSANGKSEEIYVGYGDFITKEI